MTSVELAEELRRLRALMRHGDSGTPMHGQAQNNQQGPGSIRQATPFAIHGSQRGLLETRTDPATYELLMNPPSVPPRSTYFCLDCGSRPGDGVSSLVALRECTGCRRVWYCSRECQKNNWIVHKLSCDAPAAQMVASSNFKYSALGAGAGQIRLLCVLPGSPGSSLRCQLFDADMATRLTSYEALSYTWGDSNDTVAIVLNGKPFTVTRNLHEALQHFRDSSRHRVLWVDAICINQKNNREKARQVRQMCRIYSSARQVLIWVGEASVDSDLALQSIKKMADPIYEQVALDPELTVRFRKLFVEDEAVTLALSRFGVLRPYWKRAWVVQEVSMARKGVIVCGTRTISWECLMRAAKNLREYEERRVDRSRSLGYYWKDILTLAVLCRQVTQEFSILHLLNLGWLRESSDARDKVHAFLGLPCRENTSSFTIDYGVPVEQVYTQFAIWHIRQTLSLDVLRYACSESRSPRLYSWVPDWRKHHSVRAQRSMSGFISPQSSVYCAGTKYPLPEGFFDYLGTGSHDQPAMFHGVVVDRIKEVSGRFATIGQSTHPDSSVIRGCISMMRSIPHDNNPYTRQTMDTSDFTYVVQEGHQNTEKDKSSCADTETFRFPTEHTTEELNLIEALWRTLMGDRVKDIHLPLRAGFDATILQEHTTTQDSTGSGQPNRHFWPVWQHWYDQHRGTKPIESTNSLFTDIAHENVKGKCFMITEKGYMGLVSAYTPVGDYVVVLLGGHLPQVLRKTDNNNNVPHSNHHTLYQCRGDCYVQGIMNGEALEFLPNHAYPDNDDDDDNKIYLI